MNRRMAGCRTEIRWIREPDGRWYIVQFDLVTGEERQIFEIAA